jgi:hypothetical protein
MESNLAQVDSPDTAIEQQNITNPLVIDNKKKFHKKKYLLLFIVIILFIFATIAIYLVNMLNHRWTIYENFSGFPTGDGKFARLIIKDASSINIGIEIFDPKTGQTKQRDIFKGIPSYTPIKFITDQEGKRLWIIKNPNQDCSAEGVISPNLYCKTAIYKYDYELGENKLVKELQFAKNIYPSPVFLDSSTNSLWIINYADFSKGANDGEMKKIIRNSKILRVDTKNYDITEYNFPYYADGWGDIYNIGFSNNKYADTDKEGNLYVLTSSESTSNGGKPFGSNLVRIDIRNTNTELIVIPQFKYSNGVAYSFTTGEVGIDKEANAIYLTNNTWDGNEQSTFLKYNRNNHKFTEIGKLNNDDVRGYGFFDGRLLAGGFKGLYVYDGNWSVFKKENGLAQTQIKKIYKNGNNICFTHESTEITCTNIPLFLIFGTKVDNIK